jgi:gamma-glutamyl:cysteine ligase YbdK (ATP-grasp superfamily)
MGLTIAKADFSRSHFDAFRDQLDNDLAELKRLLADPSFGAGEPSFGAEMEMYLIDGRSHPAYLNNELLELARDPRLTLELNRYNLEYNADYYPTRGRPFSAMRAELENVLVRLNQLAGTLDTRCLAIGILPTLRRQDFGIEVMTDEPRYHALTEGLRRLRQQQPFAVEIHGEESVEFTADHLTYEGANTSFQFHYRVTPADFARTYNAFQLVVPVTLALAANSPFFMGRKLWHETRIPLFKQSVDSRRPEATEWHQPSRVSYGHGWLRQGAWELFAEAASLYPPILPVFEPDDSPDRLHQAPSLFALRLHESTVWYWNRPVYDFHGNGHLRIELRALPSGPTIADMLANAAFTVGAAVGLGDSVDELLCCLPFSIAQHNFYHAAKHGIDCQLVWPRPGQDLPGEQHAIDIARALLPLAETGLASLGVDESDYRPLIDIIDQRLLLQQNGASWQRATLARLEAGSNRREALAAMLEHYIARQREGAPVAQWSLPS